MESFVNYCKDYITDNLLNYEGQMIYGCDLGITICEGCNVDGTLTYSTRTAIDYLREWWDDCSEYWEYEEFAFGEHTNNPFSNPEAYMVCMVIRGVEALLSSCGCVEEHWNDYLTLTEDVINEILEYVEEQTEINF